MWVFLNGRFVDEQHATVSIQDRGFLYGEGVFETMRVYGGRVFRWSQHIARLRDGLRFFQLPASLPEHELAGVVSELVERNRVANGMARIYQTRDSLLVQVHPREFAPRSLVVMVTDVRVDPQLSRFKTANRLPYILAHHLALRHGADEALLVGVHGQAVELTTSNLFAFFEGELWTPPLSDGPLPGVTRAVVLELARSLRIPVREESFRPRRLETAEEAFATNSLIELAPIVNWSKTDRLTVRLQQAYRERVQQELPTR